MSGLAHLNAIRAFEAVARNGSYARAAKELGVTPAAIGQHVRALEAQLGAPLFSRRDAGPNRLVLTERAKLAAFEFRAAFETIERAIVELGAPSREALTVTASQAFVGKWLMSRLDAFTTAHPSLDVRLDVSDRLVDVARGEAMVGIRCGGGSWPGLAVTRLMGEEVFPVCAPSLRPRRRAALSDLGASGLKLIHDLMQEGTGAFPTWQAWLSRAGMSPPSRGGLVVNSSVAAIQAAVEGSGVALARSVLVQDDIERGLLVRLCPEISFPVAWSYWFVRSRQAEKQPQIRAFRNWIVKRCQA